MKYLAIIACLALALPGCGKDDAKKPATTKPAATAAAKPKPTATAVAKEEDAELDDKDIPVAEDYEEKAEKEITETNLKEELAKLEKEIAEGK